MHIKFSKYWSSSWFKAFIQRSHIVHILVYISHSGVKKKCRLTNENENGGESALLFNVFTFLTLTSPSSPFSILVLFSFKCGTGRPIDNSWFIHSLFFSPKWINYSKPWGRYAKSARLEEEEEGSLCRGRAFAAMQRPQTMLSFFLIPFLERILTPSMDVSGCKRMF